MTTAINIQARIEQITRDNNHSLPVVPDWSIFGRDVAYDGVDLQWGNEWICIAEKDRIALLHELINVQYETTDDIRIDTPVLNSYVS
jgi:hypothetical protein